MSELGDRVIEPSGDPEIGSSGQQDCIHPALAVIATWRSGHVIKRRRQCLICGERFSTEEKLFTPTNGDNRTSEAKTG
jgi:hypothetical protein